MSLFRYPTQPNFCGKHTEGPWHSCAYVDARNAKIAAAERYANNMWGAICQADNPHGQQVHEENKQIVRDQWARDWNVAFHFALGNWDTADPDSVPNPHAAVLN